MKAIHSNKEYLVDRFLDLQSKIPDGRLLWFCSSEWNMPYNVGPNKDVATSLFKQAYKAQGILDNYDLEDWTMKDVDSDEYTLAFRGSEQIGIISFYYEVGELAEGLESLFNTIVIDRPKQKELDSVLNKTPKKEDNFDIPKMIDWHEI